MLSKQVIRTSKRRDLYLKCIFILIGILRQVEGWPCESPVRKVYSRINTDAVLQFSADLTNLNAPRQFYVRFHDGTTQARIRYNTNKSYTTSAIPGVNITGNATGNVIVTLQNVQLSNAGIYTIGSSGFQYRCNCLYILGTPTKPIIALNKVPSVGESATLACSSASASTPSNHSLSLKYSWGVDSADNPGGSRYSYSINRNTLTLSNIVLDDANKRFTCTATENVTDGYTSSRSDSFSFNINYEGISCESPVRTLYSKRNNETVLQFSANLTNLDSPRMFSLKFHDDTTLARIRYNADRSYTTDALPGVNIAGDTAGNVVVTLSDVQLDNAGLYTLSSAGLPIRCNGLYILGVPTKPAITLNKVPSVGENATLTCNSTSTTTPSIHILTLTYNWTVDNVDNPTASRYSYSTNKNTLTLSSIVKDDANKTFTCTATENITDGLTSSWSDSFSFDVHYGPENLVLSPNDTNYERAESTNLNSVTCGASCNPACSFNWIKIGQAWIVSNTSVLNLGNLTVSKAGTYRCTATRPGGSIQTKDLIVNVIYGPRNMVLNPNDTHYRRDENVDLPPINCSADCWDCSYRWSGPKSFSASGPVLDFDSLNRSMAGQYTCTATNTKLTPQTQQSKEVQLKVRYGPESVTLTPGNENYTVDEGSRLSNIKCVADCFPECTYNWTKEGQTAALSNTGILPLGQMQKSFTGNYTCRATNGDTASRWVDKHVVVNVRYGPYLSSTQLSPTTLEYTRNEGTNLQDISCSADCYPECTYTWTKAQQGKTATVSNTGILPLGNLERDDAAVFTCTAKNPGKSASPTTTKHVTVQVRYGPDTANVNVQSPYSLTEGDANVKIECSSDCYPGCSYTWTNLTSGSRISSNGILSFETVTMYMKGDFKCTSSNTAADQLNKSSEITVTINVKEPTLVKSFHIGSIDSQTSVTVDEHDVELRFTCIVGGDPAESAKIMFKGETLQEQADTNVLIFILHNVDCFHAGIYTCESRNSYGQISTKIATLFVRCSPRPLRQIRENITSPLYVPVLLRFVTLAYPEPGPKRFSWYKEKGVRWIPILSNEDFQISSSGLQSNLTILNVSQSDYGQYRVTIENDIGTYNQYLFLLGTDLQVTRPECREDKTAMVMTISVIILGILCVVLATYATYLTILKKRNAKYKADSLDDVPSPYGFGNKGWAPPLSLTETYDDVTGTRMDLSKWPSSAIEVLMIKPPKSIRTEDSSKTQTTYVNMVYKSDDTNIEGDAKNLYGTDDATDAEEDTMKQYTELAQFSRDDKMYDVIQKV